MAPPEIPTDLAQEMAVLVRELHADHIRHDAHDYVQDFVARTASIVARLPDPDIVEARSVAAEAWREKHASNGYGYGRDADLIAGKYDNSNDVRAALAGIKRGRALARGTSL